MIAEPFTRAMCSTVNDGASCIVVTSAERAKDCRHAPVWVVGGAQENRSSFSFEPPTLRMMNSRERMVKVIEIVRQYRNDVPDLCPEAHRGIHTYDRTICRKVRDPKLSVATHPQTDGRHGFVLLGKD